MPERKEKMKVLKQLKTLNIKLFIADTMRIISMSSARRYYMDHMNTFASHTFLLKRPTAVIEAFNTNINAITFV